MAATYEPIATTTLGSASNSVSFTSISGSFTDIIIICNYVHSVASNILGRFNSDTGSNYSWTFLEGLNSAAGSGRGSSQAYLNLGYSFGTNSHNSNIIQIQNYSNTTTYKTAINRQNQPTGYVSATVNLWRSTAAITAIELYPVNGNFNSGSTFTLYGIASA